MKAFKAILIREFLRIKWFLLGIVLVSTIFSAISSLMYPLIPLDIEKPVSGFFVNLYEKEELVDRIYASTLELELGDSFTFGYQDKWSPELVKQYESEGNTYRGNYYVPEKYDPAREAQQIELILDGQKKYFTADSVIVDFRSSLVDSSNLHSLGGSVFIGAIVEDLWRNIPWDSEIQIDHSREKSWSYAPSQIYLDYQDGLARSSLLRSLLGWVFTNSYTLIALISLCLVIYQILIPSNDLRNRTMVLYRALPISEFRYELFQVLAYFVIVSSVLIISGVVQYLLILLTAFFSGLGFFDSLILPAELLLSGYSVPLNLQLYPHDFSIVLYIPDIFLILLLLSGLGVLFGRLFRNLTVFKAIGFFILVKIVFMSRSNLISLNPQVTQLELQNPVFWIAAVLICLGCIVLSAQIKKRQRL
jgi:hypothetical protein